MAESDGDEVRVRSFWSGTITFGLVSIPVELFPANRSQSVSLRMVSPDGTLLARRYFCPRDERELDWDEIVRGYEVEEDQFVVITDDELEKLAPEKTRDIDLRRFVDASEIDPIYFERAYYLTPGGNSTKAYRLLAETMEQTGRAGIATFVMRGREYLVAIFAENGIMRAETLRFADEVRSPEDIGLTAPVSAKGAVVTKIEKAIAKLVAKRLDEEELTDRASAQLLKLVARKEKAGEDVVQAPDGEVASGSDVIDLMEVLKRSLRGSAPDRPADTAKASAARAAKKTTKKTPKTPTKTAKSATKRAAPKKPGKAAAKAPAKAAKAVKRKPAKSTRKRKSA